MKRPWTRRKFLKASLQGSIAVGSGSIAGLTAAPVRDELPKRKPFSAGLSPKQLGVLRAAMDEIIPASDEMPAASQIGGVEYLDQLCRRSIGIRKDLDDSLAALDSLSQKKLDKHFPSLSHLERVEALQELEKAAPESFSSLRDAVYEAYYLQPRVWKLIDYEFYPTNQAGPHMKPFDEAALSKVRKLPKSYREVG